MLFQCSLFNTLRASIAPAISERLTINLKSSKFQTQRDLLRIARHTFKISLSIGSISQIEIPDIYLCCASCLDDYSTV